MKRTLFLLSTAALAACSSLLPVERPLYRCEHGIEFRVQRDSETAILEGTRGYEVLYKSKRASSSAASILYDNALMSAEFGAGVSGKEALLRYPTLPLVARCVLQ